MYTDEFTKSYLETIKTNSRLQWLKQRYSNHEITTQDIIQLLNISLIDQWLAQFNYFRSYHLSETDGKADYDPQFKQHEDDECQHRHEIADRIRELNARVLVDSIPVLIGLNSAGNSWSEQTTNNSNDILLHRLQEQKQAVEFYSFFLNVIDKMTQKDTTTYDLIKDIKSDQQQHVKDLNDLAIQHGLVEVIGPSK